jgi:hypothetical protein
VTIESAFTDDASSMMILRILEAATTSQAQTSLIDDVSKRTPPRRVQEGPRCSHPIQVDII